MTTKLLTRGNRELAQDGIYTWSIPALFADINGKRFHTCPNAGICATLCYARNGTYLFSNVRKAHTAKLERVLADRDKWQQDMNEEIAKLKPTGQPNRITTLLDTQEMSPWQQKWAIGGGRAIRIHDAGDFFDTDYFKRWVQIARDNPDVLFYAYTKEVQMTICFPVPVNMVIIYSLGGKQDAWIDRDEDRHAEVFPTMEALLEAGYTDQSASDLLAPLLPTNRIGIVANNIKHFRKKQGDNSFSQLQVRRNNPPVSALIR